MPLLAVMITTLLFTAATTHAEWYISLGVGAGKADTMQQAGDNRDTTCYPDDDCSHQLDGLINGYRWGYNLHADNAIAYELAVGYNFKRFRIELATGRQTFDLDQRFTGGSYLDGSHIRPAVDTLYTAKVQADADDLTLHTLSFNAYYEFPLAISPVTPYVGLGLGIAFAELSGLFYQSEYSVACDDTETCLDPRAYNGRQLVDLTDIVPAAHLHLGADYRLSGRLSLGLKLSYHLAGNLHQDDAYEYHAIADLTSHIEISGIRYWTALATLKWELRPDHLSQERGR